jgi:4-hydroxythreonine-4-phosphate dehydrogenase
MKVYVSQGHENGIGLEVFFKTILLTGADQIELAANKQAISRTLKSLRIPFVIKEQSIVFGEVEVFTHWIEGSSSSQTFESLEYCMAKAEKGGVLYTLPTSKDQFPNGFAGHTEYFRHRYKIPELGMFFSSERLQVLLLSDHLPIAALSPILTEEIIYQRLRTAIKSLQSLQWPIARILVSGLNPHAGEGGLIGTEDSRIRAAIKRLSSEIKIQLLGPFPGDTMAMEQKSPKDLLVFMFHDQGLGLFKGLQGFIGSNITLGLPYPRFSPDHGTSFSLYGKNVADYRGCEFSLKQALGVLKKVSHGKDSSHKGKGS